jgi:tRNA-2-methylthio-N6-dimethylallyladenosine synthase
LAQVPGLDRIRFMTSHPRDFSAGLIRALADEPPVCEHLHLPVQSGSDAILDAMGRGYTRAAYLDLVGRLRAAVPAISLTTDLIIGFPGESERDFEDTLSLVEEADFDAAFTFVYSPRVGTRAAALPGRVDQGAIEGRMARLVGLVQGTAARKNHALLGQSVEVLIEGASRQDPAMGMGRTRTHKTVNVAGEGLRLGDLVQVRLDEATSTSFKGHVVG